MSDVRIESKEDLDNFEKSRIETINHPAHYGGKDNPYEVIKIIEALNLSFCLGNTVKYICRAGKKPRTEVLEDLKKAAWYLNREIESLESTNQLR